MASVHLSLLLLPLFLSFSFAQEEPVCEVGEFRNNVTVTSGRLLRISCPLASSPACLLATTRVQWQWAPDQDQPRTAVSSQFDNPPYFYLLGVLPSQSGWYWCVLGESEAGLAVTVVDPEASPLVLPVVPTPSSEHTSPAAATTPRPRVVSTSISTATTERSRAGRKESGDSVESDVSDELE